MFEPWAFLFYFLISLQLDLNILEVNKASTLTIYYIR